MKISSIAKSFSCVLLVLLLPLQQVGIDNERIPVYAKNGMVSSASMLASEVGRDVLKSGGNAIDAAVATAFTLAVTWPSAGNIGGGGFIVYLDKDGESTTFDFREKAPLASTEEMYLGENGSVKANSNHRGILAVGVPGTVAGLFQAHQKYGKLNWSDLVDPAVKLASDGFPMSWAIHNATNRYKNSYFERWPSSAKAFLKENGDVYQPHEIWKQPDLAATLGRIRDEGHDGFYKGETARKLADFMKSNGGLITEQDMAKYQAVERQPIRGTYRGYDIISMPPPSSGGTALVEMLNILEGYNLKEIGHNSALYLHLITEAMRRGFSDRAQHLGDPDFNADMPIEKLISKEHADELREGIDLFMASESDSAFFNGAYESENTTHFSVLDSEGNAVSLTYTLEQGYGTKIVAEGLGFLLNNENGRF